jgi:N-acetylmuramoyl-L-alanine amidase
MKRALPSCLLAVLALTAITAQSAARRPESVQVAGKEYVRLADWAKANGFEVRWLKAQETLQLSNHAAKLVVGVDSREAEVNGVAVWLSFPVVVRNGAVCLARLDLQTTLQPVLWPPKNRSGARIKSICLDPGHGGKDPGNRVGANQEKKYTLLLAQEVRDQLTRAGLKVTLTRTTDTFVELPTRPDLARRRKADLFVSLHFNSTESSRNSVQGAEVYCLTPAGASSTNARGEGGGAGWFPGNRYNDKNMFLAYQVQKALTKSLAVEDRGVRRARWAVLRDAVMPALLIEAGFMSHPVEGRKIFDASYRRQMAKAIVDGVLAYKRVVEQAADAVKAPSR